MAIKQPSIQSVRKSGHISPQIVLIRHQLTKPMTMEHYEHGIIMDAGFFNAHTLKLERTGKFRWHGPMTFYFFATDKFPPEWCYIAWWDNYTQTYVCSCYQRKSNTGDCEHCIALDRMDSVLL